MASYWSTSQKVYAAVYTHSAIYDASRDGPLPESPASIVGPVLMQKSTSLEVTGRIAVRCVQPAGSPVRAAPSLDATVLGGVGAGVVMQALERRVVAGSAWYRLQPDPTSDVVKLFAGARVTLQGLKAAPELNGRTGVIQSFNANRGRYAVLVDPSASESATQGSFKADNLVMAVSDNSTAEWWVPRAAADNSASAEATANSFLLRDAFVEEPAGDSSAAVCGGSAALSLVQNGPKGDIASHLLLQSLTRAALVNAPVKALSHWLDALVCAGAAASEADGESSSSSDVGPDMGSDADEAWASAKPFLLTAPTHALDLVAGSNGGASGGGSGGSGGEGPCGYQFKRGDICWNCRTCQVDNTCVLCDACFQASDHTGHHVLFHQAGIGGCCDCGDSEAWAPSGCCLRHRPIAAAGSSLASDLNQAAGASDCMPCDDGNNGNSIAPAATSGLPPGLVKALEGVCKEVAWFLVAGTHGSVAGFSAPNDPGGNLAPFLASDWRNENNGNGNDNSSSNPSDSAGSGGVGATGWIRSAFSALRGTSAPTSLTSAAAASSSSLSAGEAAATHKGGNSSCKSGMMHNRLFSVRVHNDDVHTYDDVISAFHAIGLSNSEAMAATLAVDKRGSALVRQGLTAAQAARCVTSLHAKGLLACASLTSPDSSSNNSNSDEGEANVDDNDDIDDGASSGAKIVLGGQIALEARVEACVAWLDALAARGKPFREAVGAALLDAIPSAAREDSGGGGEEKELLMPPPPPLWRVLERFGANIVREEEGVKAGAPRRVAVLGAWHRGPTMKRASLLQQRQQSKGSQSEAVAMQRADSASEVDGAEFGEEEEEEEEEGLQLKEDVSSMGGSAAGVPGWFTPHEYTSTPLLLLMLADPFLATPKLRSGLGQLYLRLLPDPDFKAALGATLAAAQPHLALLFARGIGVSAQPSALDLGVQLWTTPSLVARLNQSPPPLTHDEGSGGSALPLVESMLTTLCASLEGPGGLETRAELPQAWTKQGAAARGQEVVDVGKHWEQPFFTFQRINAQVRELGYVLACPGVAPQLFAGSSPSAHRSRSLLLRSLALFQGSDPLVRTPATKSHDDYESMRWQLAWTAHLPLSSMVHATVAKVLQQQQPPPTTTPGADSSASTVHAAEAMHALLGAAVVALMEWTAQAAAEDEGSRRAAKGALPAGDTRNWGELMAIVGAEDHKHDDEGSSGGSGGALKKKKRKYGSGSGEKGEEGDDNREVRFQVGRGPVSLHLGLHRLVALLMRKLAEHTLPLPSLQALPQLIRPHKAVQEQQHRLSALQLASSPTKIATTPAAVAAAFTSAGSMSMPIAVGRRVQVEGLSGRKELNGSIGLAEEYHPSLGRWVVALVGENGVVNRMRIKPVNLRVVEAAMKGTSEEVQQEQQPHQEGATTIITDDARFVRKRFAWCLLEQPLRALSWCGQVRAGAWKRNGSPAASQAGAYGEPPLAATHRDLDLVAVQTAGLLLGPEELLETVLRRSGGCARQWLQGSEAVVTWHRRLEKHQLLPCGHLQDGATAVPPAETKRAGYLLRSNSGPFVACQVCGDVAPATYMTNTNFVPNPLEERALWVETAVEYEHMLKLQEECLTLVVHLVTELPRIKATKAVSAASGLEHHLAHCLAAAGASGATRSELASQAAPYFAAQEGHDDNDEGPNLEDLEDSEGGESGNGGGSMPAGSDAALDAAIARVAVAPSSSSSSSSGGGGSGSGGRKFVLSAAGASLYDPCCPRLRREAHTKATELVASLMRRQPSPAPGSTSNNTNNESNQPIGWRPVVGPPPPTSPVLGIGVRRAMLLSPLLQRMLGSVLRRHGNPKNWSVGNIISDSKVWCEPLVLLAIHLMTLSVHECAAQPLEAEASPSSSSSAVKMEEDSKDNREGELRTEDDRSWLHPSSLGLWDGRSDSDARQSEARAFLAALTSPLTYPSEQELDPPPSSLLSLFVDLWFAVRDPSGSSSSSGGADETSGDQGLLPALHMQGLGWLLTEIGKRDSDCQSYLESRSSAAVEAGKAPLPGCAVAAPAATADEDGGSSSSSGAGGGAEAAAVPSAAERRAAAQARAMAAMKKSQLAFAATLDGADDNTDESDTDGGSGGSSSCGGSRSRGGDAVSTHVAPVPECCICRDSNSSSSAGSGSNSSDVVAYMCLAQRSSMLGSAAWQHFEKKEGEGGTSAGTAIGQRQLAVGVGAGSDIFATAASNPLALAENQSSGSSSSSSSRSSSSGSSSSSSSSGSAADDHHPAPCRLSWQQWGPRRVHVQSCGHGVHPRCWEHAFVKDLTRALEAQRDAPVAFNPRNREFLCPLCKVLCNTLVPYCAPTSQSSDLSPVDIPPQAAASDSSLLASLTAWANSGALSGALLSSENADNGPAAPLAASESSSSLHSAQTLFLDMLEEADNGGSSSKTAARMNKTSHASILWTQAPGRGTPWLLACSSLGYTLACLEATTRDNWAAPKAGSGFHASALQAMGLAIMHAATGASGGETPKYNRLQALRARSLVGGCRSTSATSSSGDGTSGGGGSTSVLGRDGSDNKDAQPPALTWDLTTLAVAALTAPANPLPTASVTQGGEEDGQAPMSQGNDRIHIAQALVLLRLAQVLLEPPATKSIPGGGTTAAATEAPLQGSSSPLERLRAALAARAGVTVDLGAPSGEDLINVVEESLTPFAFVVALLAALLGVSPDDKNKPAASSGSGEDVLTARVSSVFAAGRDLSELLPLLGLHQDSSEDLASGVLSNQGGSGDIGGCFSALLAPWADHLKAHVNAATRASADQSSDAANSSDAIVAPLPFFFGSSSASSSSLVTPTFDVSSLSSSLTFMPALAPLPKRFTDLFAAVARALPSLEAAVSAERQRLKLLIRSSKGASANGAGGVGSMGSNVSGWNEELDQGNDPGDDNAFSPNALASAAAVEDLEGPLDKLEPALCLITGQLLPAGLKMDPRNPRMGALTAHARTLSGGTGLYLLVNRSLVLGVRGAHAATLPHWSPYLDSYGEPDEGLVRGRPLFLDDERWAGLQRLYTNHRVGTEVSRLRATADRYIKDNYY